MILFSWTLFAAIPESGDNGANWGFFGHQKINQLATFILPMEMIPFFKHHIDYISAKAVNPDRRRYIIPDEAARHYIDLDVYGDSAWIKMPRYWEDAVSQYSSDTLNSYGIVPWHVFKIKNYLTAAFRNQDSEQILRLATDLGHYIADANVPLHTTKNYNGQFTNQFGIHGFWESRLPELFSEDYDLYTGKATYIENTQLEIWNGVIAAHLALDSVLRIEKELTDKFRPEKKFAYEDRQGRTLKVYSQEFSEAYHRKLDGMVEKRMRAAIKMVGDFWYTAWVDGGQPDLTELIGVPPYDSITVQSNVERKQLEHEAGVVVDDGKKKP